MRHFTQRTIAEGVVGVIALFAMGLGRPLRADQDNEGSANRRFIPNATYFVNPAGASQTFNAAGDGIDTTGPFFQALGSNGRSCASCHQPSEAMSISAAGVELRFTRTG